MRKLLLATAAVLLATALMLRTDVSRSLFKLLDDRIPEGIAHDEFCVAIAICLPTAVLAFVVYAALAHAFGPAEIPRGERRCGSDQAPTDTAALRRPPGGRKVQHTPWLGRAILAILAASTLGFLVGFAIYRFAEANGWGWFWAESAYSASGPGAIMAVSAAFFALLVFRILTGRYVRSHETCCRRCGYILRGISEPRCPECGEQI